MRRTLVVVPHPDDEAISCGGFIQRRVAAGGQVFVLSVYGRRYDYGRKWRPAWEDEEADFIRAKEVLGYQVGMVALSDREGEPAKAGYYKALEIVEKALAEWEPDEVVVPAHDDLNQDHQFLSHVMEIALRPSNLGTVKRVLEFFALDGRIRQPDWYEPLTYTQVGRKVDAIQCYRREKRDTGPRSPNAVAAQAAVWGASCGVEYAEGYRHRFSRQ